MTDALLTAQQVRSHLLTRIDAYQAATGIGDAKIGTEAVGDHKIVARIRGGENFTLKTYERLLTWLEGQRTAA